MRDASQARHERPPIIHAVFARTSTSASRQAVGGQVSLPMCISVCQVCRFSSSLRTSSSTNFMNSSGSPIEGKEDLIAICSCFFQHLLPLKQLHLSVTLEMTLPVMSVTTAEQITPPIDEAACMNSPSSCSKES
ncbi:uncharacterized protein LOC112877801 [Panicum hallii]|uniref:uncharacterized protein LOC112877801 n=1 Tax=Panicum hallii TaxID=206008 RepID=UPI000DF4D337|nr:uncharacterized protein LOC112877801 [Panicum hallii]